MSVIVRLSANTLQYRKGGGHMWVLLNWALGLRELGSDFPPSSLIAAGADRTGEVP